MTTPIPYQLGEAAGLLHKCAGDSTVSYSLVGTLYFTPKGWGMLSVPNALVRGAFDALHEIGAELPYNDDGRLNAHISCFRPSEVEQIGGADRVQEKGHQFRFTLGPLCEVEPAGWEGISKVWFIRVKSPDIEKLRKSYGLSALPNNDKFDLHITIGRRKVNVLRDNEVVKESAYGPPYRCETCCKAFAQFPDGIDKCTACSGDLIPEQTFREKWPDRDTKSAGLISVGELAPSHPDYPRPSWRRLSEAAMAEEQTGIIAQNPSALDALLQAKQHSDHRDYRAKHRILSRLLRQRPQDFVVDQPHPDFPGLTHTPTGFRAHAPFSLASLATGTAKTAATSPVLSTHIDRRSDGQDLDRIDAHVGGKNVGYLTSHPAASGDHRWVEGLEVDPGFRRQGLAGLLLGDAVGRYGDRELRLRGRPYGDEPVPAGRLQALYSRFGFSPYDDEGRMMRPPTPSKTASTLRDLFGCQSTGTDYPSHPKEANAMSQQERVRLLLPTPTGHLMELFDNPKYPDNLGQFRFPGGGVEPGETYEQAAVREAREELGVDLTGKAIRYVGADHRPEYAHEHYLAVDDHGVSPGSFADQANPGSKVTLFDGRPEGEKYVGPDVTKLIAKAAKEDRPVPADWNDPADREDCPHCHVMHERGDGFCNSCGGRWPAKTK